MTRLRTSTGTVARFERVDAGVACDIKGTLARALVRASACPLEWDADTETVV